MKIPICVKCRHFNRKDSFVPVFKCKAFPIRVPKIIFEGESDHLEPLEGQDNDIIYEPIKEV